MARSAHEKAELCREHISAELPHWILHPEVVRTLRLRQIILTPFLDYHGARGLATRDGNVCVNVSLHRFRSSSPYTTPRGKADISPVGVTAHELGHILWFAMERRRFIEGWLTGWHNLFRQNKREAITSYARVHPEEDMAESHRLFLLNRKLLKHLSPSRHWQVRSMYSQLLGTPTPHRDYKLSRADFENQFDKLIRFRLGADGR